MSTSSHHWQQTSTGVSVTTVAAQPVRPAPHGPAVMSLVGRPWRGAPSRPLRL